jgi:hypothetical protein
MIGESVTLVTALTMPECRAALSRLIIEQADWLLPGPRHRSVRLGGGGFPQVPGAVREDSFWLMYPNEQFTSPYHWVVRGRLHERPGGTEIVVTFGPHFGLALVPRGIAAFFTAAVVLVVVQAVAADADAVLPDAARVVLFVAIFAATMLVSGMLRRGGRSADRTPPRGPGTGASAPPPAVVTTLCALLDARAVL